MMQSKRLVGKLCVLTVFVCSASLRGIIYLYC